MNQITSVPLTKLWDQSVSFDVGTGGGALAGDWNGTFLTEYANDYVGRRIDIVHPDSTKVHYQYEGAFLTRVCDIDTSDADCTASGATHYISEVTYDRVGRRETTESPVGVRTFQYDGGLSRLKQDHFNSPYSGYDYVQNFDQFDGMGNLEMVSGSSQPGDVSIDAVYAYDNRNRLDTWIKDGVEHDYDYDELGNMIIHAGQSQVFGDPLRPHAVSSAAGGTVSYGYDDDGNIESKSGTSGSQYYDFNSANQLTCFKSTSGGDCDRAIHYDVDGRRVLEDELSNYVFTAFIGSDYRVRSGPGMLPQSKIEVMAFDERVALKTSTEGIRAASFLDLVPVGVWRGLAIFALSALGLSLIVVVTRHGAVLVVVATRPHRAAMTALLVIGQLFLPVPGAFAGGGSSSSEIYWELADRLGSGLIILDADGERLEHRTYMPFGTEYARVGSGPTFPAHFGGHLRDEESGLLYMGARWMDPTSGTFLSIDPLIPSMADPQLHNAYSYVRNNPAMMTDPDGMCPRLGVSCGVYTNVALGYKTVTTTTVRVGGEVVSSYTYTGFSSSPNGSASLSTSAPQAGGDQSSAARNSSSQGANAGAGVSAGPDQGGGFWRGVGNFFKGAGKILRAGASLFGRGLGFVMIRGANMIRTHLFRQKGHGPIFGRQDAWIGPHTRLGRTLGAIVPFLHQISADHDWVVNRLTTKHGVPDGWANYPTMLPTAAVSIPRTSVNLAVDAASLGFVPVPFPHSDVP